MDHNFQNLLHLAYDIGRQHESFSSGGTIDELYQSGGDFHEDFLPTVKERHEMFFARFDFERLPQPAIVLAILESLACGSKKIENDQVIGYEFPIFISREYIYSVLGKWGFGK